jgi:POT family proton-dependent oligopeptide transporter
MNDASSTRDTHFLGHPKGLRTLFFTEMWERFSYYGMRAILTLYMLAAIESGGMGLEKSESGPIYAMYTSLVYLMAIPGGWLADNVLGLRRAVLWGGVLIFCGHVSLALHGTAPFFIGLALVVLGTGLLKPNISSVVGGLYAKDDERRDAGFSLFYMGINIGAFSAPLVCGWLAQSETFRSQLASWGLDPKDSWHWGFGAAAVGMALGLVQYVLTGRHLGDVGAKPAPARSPSEAAARVLWLRSGAVAFALVIAAVAGLAWKRPDLMTSSNVNSVYVVVLVSVVVGVFAKLLLGAHWTPAERKRLWVIAILFAGSAVFWGVFEQAGSTLNIFADESTHNEILGQGFASSWWQSVNAALLVIFSYVFTWLWGVLGKRNPSYPFKFALGLVFAGLGFLYLVGGAKLFGEDWSEYEQKNHAAIVAAAEQYSVKLDGEKITVAVVAEILAKAKDQRITAAKASGADPTQVKIDDVLPPWKRVHVHWLFIVYLMHTIGELCLSPVGLSAMTKLAPQRVVGLMLGVWFLSLSLGNYLGGSVAGYYEKFELPTLLTLVACSAFAMALVMLALMKPIDRMLKSAEALEQSGASH